MKCLFTFERSFVIKGENKRDLTCGFGRSTRQAHHKGRQGARRGFRLHLWSEIPKPSGTRVPRPAHSVFVCICIYMHLFVFFVSVFCFTFYVWIGHERAKASGPCIMPRIERPLWGKPISGYNATQPDALIEISHSRLGRSCQMYS